MGDSKPNPSTHRRDFLKLTGVATAGVLAGAALPRSGYSLPWNPATFDATPTRNLGGTGFRPGIFSLGGQAAIEQDNEKLAMQILERAYELGVNYQDTAAIYGGKDRWSQRHIGQVMKTHRKQVFLASKTHDRTRDGSLKLLEESLKLLNTDHLDLWQVHNLSRMEQVEQIFAKGGAVEALHQAREQKMVRFIGITGHADPAVLMEAIRRGAFDTILMSLNAADKHHMSFIEKLLPMAVEKRMGIIGMKIPARGRILAERIPPPQPQGYWAGPGKLAMREALYYVLSLPISTVIIGCDTVEQLESNVKMAREFTPLSDAELAALAAKAEPIARQALYFRPWGETPGA